MSSKFGFWRKCRIAFRCARFTVWGLLLLLLLAFAWLNVVGLPNFLKARLVGALRERGVQLEFSRMRWRLIHGLICDNVRIGDARNADGPVLTVKEVQLRLDYPALLHRRLQVDGLVLRQGDLLFPVADSDSLALTNLQTELRFDPDDTWSLDQFRAGFAGVTFTLGGSVAHAPAFRSWKMFSAAKSTDRGSVEASLKNFSDVLKQIHFAGKPEVNARVSGDAREVHSFTLALNVRAPGVQTPWFSATNLEFAARVLASTNEPAAIDPAWAFWTNLQPFQIDWIARGEDLKMDRLEADAVDCRAVWNAPEFALPEVQVRLGGGALNGNARLDIPSREVTFRLESAFDPHAVAALLPENARQRLAQVSWPRPPRLQADGSMVMAPWTNRLAGWGDEIGPSLQVRGELAFTNTLVAGRIPVNSLWTHFSYSNLVWRLPDLMAVQGGTSVSLAGEEDDASRDFQCAIAAKLDAGSVPYFLTDSNAVHGLRHFQFRQPVALTLDVKGNLRNFGTLAATGSVAAREFAIREQWIDSVTATLAYSNRTADFFHPQLARAQGAERFAADKVSWDMVGEHLYLHGGAGHVSPMAVARAIGPKTARTMEPYEFLRTPDATVEGCIPLKNVDGDLVPDDADLVFNTVGTVPFRWLRFETPAIEGTIHWLGRNLILTNMTAQCYGTTAKGWGVIDTQTPGDGTDFSFLIEGTNADFNAMGRALWSPTNELRGLLSGYLRVTGANSSDWRTWDGYGQAQLRNGLIWDAPIFGAMSSVLNTLAPGLGMGNSRATEGAGRFTMTNGVIYTDSLEIRSLTMRLDYVGTVDLEERVAARVRAQLLRNTPVIGSLFSMVLMPVSKAFECEVTGTLDQPKITPVYIPFSKVLTAPLHPIRTFEGIFGPTTGP